MLNIKKFLVFTGLIILVFSLFGCFYSVVDQPIRPSTQSSNSIPKGFMVSYSIAGNDAQSYSLQSAADDVTSQYFSISRPLHRGSSQNAIIAISGQMKSTKSSHVGSVTISFMDCSGNSIVQGNGSGTVTTNSADSSKAVEYAFQKAINVAFKSVFSQMNHDPQWLSKLPICQSANDPKSDDHDPLKIGSKIKSTGTGFFVNSTGTVLTANHVVEQCPSMSIVYKDVEYPVSVIATDDKWDLAIMKGDVEPLHHAPLAEDSELKTGLEVVAFGFPLQGLLSPTPSLTKGLLSNAQAIKGKNDMLQTTAPIQPGNSGGPLIDMTGAVVGITVASLDAAKMLLATGTIPQNVNFAISVARARKFLTEKSVPITQSKNKTELKPVAIAEQAKEYTVIVICREY